jgi:hypothetical protein
LLEGHRQSGTHHIYRNGPGKRNVMVLVSDDLPDIDHDHVSDEQITFHHQAVLALFKPSRKATDIKYDDDCVNMTPDPYHMFLEGGQYPEAAADARSYVENCRDWYANERPAVEIKRGRHRTSDEEAHLRAHPCLHDHGSQQGPDSLVFDLDEQVEHDDDDDDWEPADDVIIIQQGMDRREQQFNALMDTANLVPTLEEIAGTTLRPIGPISNLTTTAAHYLDSVIDRTAILQNSDADMNDSSNSGTTIFLEAFSDYPTRLSRLEECLLPVPFDPTRPVLWMTPNDRPTFCSIADVSTTYRLNFWQHVCFEKYARHVLYSWTKDIENVANSQIVDEERARYSLQPQLIGYLGGEAGSGKSAVIAALLMFATRWGRRNTIETLAFTGVAAIQVHGKTIHSGRNVQFGKFSARSPPSGSMRDAFFTGLFDHFRRALHGRPAFVWCRRYDQPDHVGTAMAGLSGW